jgi:hypothetical protein
MTDSNKQCSDFLQQQLIRSLVDIAVDVTNFCGGREEQEFCELVVESQMLRLNGNLFQIVFRGRPF